MRLRDQLGRHAALRGPRGQRAELRDAQHDGAAAPGLRGDQQVADGTEGCDGWLVVGGWLVGGGGSCHHGFSAGCCWMMVMADSLFWDSIVDQWLEPSVID